MTAGAFAGQAEAASSGQGSTPAGSSYSSSGAGLGFGGGGNAGDNVALLTNSATVNLQDQTSGLGGAATSSATNSGVSGGVNWNNSAWSSAAPLNIHLMVNNSGAMQAAFPAGVANGGWSDGLTLTAAGQSGGAVWVVPIHIDGSMSAVGLGADGLVSLAAFANQQMITAVDPVSTNAWNTFVALNSPLYRGSASGSIWDFENVEWRAVDYGPGQTQTLQTLTVNDTIDFAVPFTWGSQFDLGIFGMAWAGEIASGGNATPNATSLDFQSTIAWGGPGYILTNDGAGPAITDFTVSSLTGANYGAPYGGGGGGAVPEPRTWLMLLLGFGLVGWIKRNPRRDAQTAS